MDAALIALPTTALLTGGLIGFLVASIANDRKDRAQPPVSFELPVTGIDDEGWTEPPRMIVADKPLPPEEAARLKKLFDDRRKTGEPIVPVVLMAEHIELAASAIRHSAQALAELSRFQQEGAFSDRFPLEEDVEVSLAKALQDTINILLAYNPTEHERGELAQLEAAIHKFITDYSA